MLSTMRKPRLSVRKSQSSIPVCLARRSFMTSPTTYDTNGRDYKPSSFGFGSTPSPPRLPEEEQKIFEELQKQSALHDMGVNPESDSDGNMTANNAAAENMEDQEILHRDAPRNRAKPEFEGERNPQTGEVGGPKNEPLKWGAQGDWSYNGRVSDF